MTAHFLRAVKKNIHGILKKTCDPLLRNAEQTFRARETLGKDIIADVSTLSGITAAISIAHAELLHTTD